MLLCRDPEGKIEAATGLLRLDSETAGMNAYSTAVVNV